MASRCQQIAEGPIQCIMVLSHPQAMGGCHLTQGSQTGQPKQCQVMNTTIINKPIDTIPITVWPATTK